MGLSCAVGLAACGSAPCASAPHNAASSSPRCDTSGVWQVRWSESAEPDLEVTLDPAHLRVTLHDEPFPREGVAMAVDVGACRAHVEHRAETRFGAEGYEDYEETLRLEFALGPGEQAVTGVLRREVWDPPSTTESRVSGTARRYDGWRP